ncbi:MAG: VWA domain-containing protein [Acidobacteriota bacterium]
MKLAKYVFLFSLIFANNLIAQKTPDKSEVPIEVKANILVVNSNEQLVNDVKQDDIKVFEDGVEQKITYFAKKEPVLNLAMVFDNSGSIQKKLDEIIKCGKIIAYNLRDTDEAFVVRFTSSDKIEVIQDYTNKKADLVEAISNLYVEGGQTAILDAVYLSAEKLLQREKTDKTKRYAILLFSDVEERDSYYKLGDVMKMFKGNDLQIFVMSYANFAPEKKKNSIGLSHFLPSETGGASFLLPQKYKDADLVNYLKLIMYELRSQYIIGYTSNNQIRDGKPRKLTVQISDNEKGEKRLGLIREGFTPPIIKK